MCEMVSHLLCPTLCPSHQGLVKSGVYVPPTLVSSTHTHACVRIRTWSVCQHNPHKVEHLHSHLTGRTKQSNLHIKAVEHAHSILDCLRLQKIEKATCLGRTLTQTWMCCAIADFMLFCSFSNQYMTNYSFLFYLLLWKLGNLHAFFQ